MKNNSTLSFVLTCWVSIPLLFSSACMERPLSNVISSGIFQPEKTYIEFADKDVDILFVIDKSESMLEEQSLLKKEFPRLIDALKSPHLDGRLPNLHVGIVTTDLGGGAFAGHQSFCESPGGDDARFIQHPKEGNTYTAKEGALEVQKPCPHTILSNGGYIEYDVVNKDGESTTNVAFGDHNATDVETNEGKVKQAFECLAQVGSDGCGMEQQLQAARLALDPSRNPGFLRKDAFLAIVIITDEDDCSAKDSKVFSQINNEYGPPFPQYRCFQAGIKCDINGWQNIGPREHCEPFGDALYPISDYVNFFKNEVKPGNGERILIAAIAGPPTPVNIVRGTSGGGESVEVGPSCGTGAASAYPAIRINRFVNAFNPNNFYFHNVCNENFGVAMNHIANKIIGNIGVKCLRNPVYTDRGGLVCTTQTPSKTPVYGIKTFQQNVPTSIQDEVDIEKYIDSEKSVVCQKDCLDRAELIVTEVVSGVSARAVDANNKALRPCISNPENMCRLLQPCEGLAQTRCQTEAVAPTCDLSWNCPCWCVRYEPECAMNTDYQSSLELRILRNTEPAKGTTLQVGVHSRITRLEDLEEIGRNQCK